MGFINTDPISAHIKFLDENGSEYGIKQVDGKPRVSATEYEDDMAEGNILDHALIDKQAINDDVDSSAEEDVWCVGGTYVWPTAEMQMEVISSSAEDDPVKADTNPGTGIHSIRIYYLDDAFTEKTTDVELNGTAAVATTATDIFRINRLRPLTMGTGLKAAGNIDVRHLNDTPIYSRIAAGFTKGRQMIYTVPVGKVFLMKYIIGSCGGTTAPKYGKFTVRSTWDSVSMTRNAWMTVYFERGASSGNTGDPKLYGAIRFPAGSDIIMSCKTLDDNCYVTGAWRGWIENA